MRTLLKHCKINFRLIALEHVVHVASIGVHWAFHDSWSGTHAGRFQTGANKLSYSLYTVSEYWRGLYSGD